MPANTTPFTIKIQLGSKKATIMLDPSNTYSSFSMNSSLSFNAEQRLFVKIIGVQEDETNKIINFQPDKEQIKTEIKPNKLYHVLISDVRMASVGDLTPEEMEEIRKEFDMMDKDKNGTISLSEVKYFYKNEMDLNVRIARKVADQKIEKRLIFKDRYEKEFQNETEFYESVMESNIAHFMERDVDNNMQVSWEEFLAHQAKVVISKRK